MADPRLKHLKIKTAIVKRLAKEKLYYDKEAEEQRAHVQKMKDACEEAVCIKKREEVLSETRMMILDCQRRLDKAFEELKNALENEKDLCDTDEYSLARKTLEEVQPMQSETGVLLHFC